jgi:ribokinase
MKRIMVFGSISYDRTLHLPRLPHAGQGVMASSVTESVGGKGANVSVAAARAGALVQLVSAVGQDGDRAIHELVEAGVDVTRVERNPSASTAEVIIHLAADQSEFGITVPGADRKVPTAAMDDALAQFRGGHIGYLDGMINDGAHVIRAAARRGAPLVINPSPLHPDVLEWPMEQAAVIMLNHGEARTLTGESGEHEQLEALHRRYAGPSVILTLGPRGAWFSHRQRRAHIPSVEVQAVDSTAAGDTFAGYLLAGLAASEPPEQAMRHAARAAALCVTRHGSLRSIPHRDELGSAPTSA